MRASKRLVDLLSGDYGGIHSISETDLKPIRIELEAMGVEFGNQGDLYPDKQDLESVLESLERIAADEGIINIRCEGREVPSGAIGIRFWDMTFQRSAGMRKTFASAGTLLESAKDLRDLLRNWSDLRKRELQKTIGIG